METLATSTTDAIRKMAVGDELSFPAEKADTIRTIVWTRLIPERASGMRWSTIVDKDNMTITIKRIA